MAVDTLGCGTYEAYFKTRGGDTFVCRARNITSLTWNRKMNGFSEASITFAMNGQDGDCCNCAGSINPWEHELSIYRDGEEVWCGPVVNGGINLETLIASFDARDLSVWLDHRWVEQFDTDVEFEEVDISVVYDWLIRHAYAQEPWNMEWTVGEVGIPIDRFYEPVANDERWSGNYPTIGRELEDLLKSGIDFTVVRRVYIAGDLEQESGIATSLTDSHWDTLPQIKIVGTGMATVVGVGGGNGGSQGWADDQIWIERPNDTYRAQYGLLQSFFPAQELEEEDTTNLPNAITQQAWELREMKKEPFVYVNGGTLSSKAPVTFDTLIPGRVFNISLTQTCRVIQNNYRLYSVSVTYDGDSENVTPELTPLGAEALRT